MSSLAVARRDPGARATAFDLPSAGPSTAAGLPRLLVLASVLYVAVPAIFLLAAWLRPPLAFAAAVAGAILLAGTNWRGERAGNGTLTPPERSLGGQAGSRRWVERVVVVMTAAGLTLTTGIGGFTRHTGDWRKHFALLHDLVEKPWPLVYDLGSGSSGVVSYYTAWYLPPALAGKVGGWAVANVVLGLWTMLGWALVMAWFTHLVRRAWAPVLLVGLAGLDVVGAWLLPRISGWPVLGRATDSLDPWSGEWVIASFLRGAYEATPQLIVGLLLMGLGLAGSFRHLPPTSFVAFVALAALSSPFAAATGSVLLLLTGHGPRAGPRTAARLTTMAAVTTAGAVVLLLATRLTGPPAGVPDEVVVGLTFSEPRFPDSGAGNLLVAAALVGALELAVYAVPLLHRASPLVDDERRLLRFALVLVGVLALFRVGLNNDLFQRGVAPSLFVLAVLVGRALTRPSPRPGEGAWIAPVLVAALAVGFVGPLLDLGNNVFGDPRFEPRYSPTEIDETPGLLDLGPIWYPDRPSILSQYLVDADAETDHPATAVLDLPG